MFFRAPNMFAYTIVHLTFRAPQIVVRARVCANVYHALYKGKRKVYYTPPSTQNLVSVSRLYFIEKELTDRSLVYLEPNNQTTFRQLRLKAMNMVGRPQCLLVLDSESVNKHFNRDIKTM